MTLRPQWLGTIPYGQALEQQRTRREAIIRGEAPEAFWLLEHPPVITVGRRIVKDLPPHESLSEAGIELFSTERGGLATYHGPGQLVGYLLVDTEKRNLKVRETVERLERGIAEWLALYSIKAHSRTGYPGVWSGGDKICAIGMHFRHGVSMHGFALNVNIDLQGFKWITPCGIIDGGVTSMKQLLGQTPMVAHIAEEVGDQVLQSLFCSSVIDTRQQCG